MITYVLSSLRSFRTRSCIIYQNWQISTVIHRSVSKFRLGKLISILSGFHWINKNQFNRISSGLFESKLLLPDPKTCRRSSTSSLWCRTPLFSKGPKSIAAHQWRAAQHPLHLQQCLHGGDVLHKAAVEGWHLNRNNTWKELRNSQDKMENAQKGHDALDRQMK